MARTIEGHLVDTGGRFAIVAGRFNDFITSHLIAGCEDALRRHGVEVDERVDLIWVPGAFEIPLICKAVIALGAVIRGSTPHFDYVASEVSKGVAHVSLDAGVPVIFGVLTTDTIEQAVERAGTKAGNKGFEAGMSALEMASLLTALRTED